jgi:hypothetical protein
MSSISHDRLLHDLTGAADGFLRSVQDVPPDRWSYSPAPEVWSVEQIAEHTTAVFRGVERLLTQKLLSQPIPAGTTRVTDDFIVRSMLDRSRRIRAPEAVLPRGRWATREEMVASFVESRELLISWCNQVTVDLRAYGAAHMVMGLLDGVQWLVFAAAHTERHTRQILELRETAGF